MELPAVDAENNTVANSPVILNQRYYTELFAPYFKETVNIWWNDFTNEKEYQNLFAFPYRIMIKFITTSGKQMTTPLYRGPILNRFIRDTGKASFLFIRDDESPSRILYIHRMISFCKFCDNTGCLCDICLYCYQDLFDVYLSLFERGVTLKKDVLSTNFFAIPRDNIQIFWTGEEFVFTLCGMFPFYWNNDNVYAYLFDVDFHEPDLEFETQIKRIYIKYYAKKPMGIEYRNTSDSVHTMLMGLNNKGYIGDTFSIPFTINMTAPGHPVVVPFPVISDLVDTDKRIREYRFKSVLTEKFELEDEDIIQLLKAILFLKTKSRKVVEMNVLRQDSINQCIASWSDSNEEGDPNLLHFFETRIEALRKERQEGCEICLTETDEKEDRSVVTLCNVSCNDFLQREREAA